MTDTHIEAEIENIINQSTNDLHHNTELDMQHQDNNNGNDNVISDNNTTNTMGNADVEVFNTALHQYLRLNEEIKTLMQAIKTRNEMKRNLSETLSNFLRTNQIKNVNLDGSYKGKRLENVVSTTATGFNRSTVTEAIYNELKEDSEIFERIMQALSRTSVMKEVWKLKIVEEKQARVSKKQNKKTNILAEAGALLDNE